MPIDDHEHFVLSLIIRQTSRAIVHALDRLEVDLCIDGVKCSTMALRIDEEAVRRSPLWAKGPIWPIHKQTGKVCLNLVAHLRGLVSCPNSN